MKFTEEQYQKIVDAWDNQILYKSATQSVIDELKVGYLNMGDQALALANPLTREWAHDKFVEEEKTFYWTSKKKDKKGWSARIMIDHDGLVRTYPIKDITKHAEDEQLTESEIKSWGYNPDMFDRKEV